MATKLRILTGMKKILKNNMLGSGWETLAGFFQYFQVTVG